MGAPRPTYGGIWKRPRGLREQSFPGRRAVGAGHARPGGLRRRRFAGLFVGRGLDPSAGCWRQRESPRVATRGRAAAQASAGRRGRRPLRFAREWAAAEGRGGVGAPRPTYGDMETLRGLRRHPFPGRRAVGAGHARPGGLRGHPSMVRSVGRGLDPSAGDCPGDGRWREPSRGVGDAAPYGLPGNGWLPRLTLPTSPPAYSRCCRRQNRWGRSAHRPDARFRRWIRSRRASGHRRSGPDGTGVCRRRNFSSAG